MRSKSLLKLLQSVKVQTLYPNEILIINGSTNDDTNIILQENIFENLKYYKVNEENRGLTKQRNFGIEHVSESSEIVCFLDDDTVLNFNYFEILIDTYKQFPKALGVGGYISNEVYWQKTQDESSNKKFVFDSWERNEPLRFRARKFFGLEPDTNPCVLPKFSHGRSVSFLPPSGKTYEVEQFMGGVSSFRKKVFQKIGFSTYFEGYGLYEDADFTLRLSKLGKLYVNTAAQLQHFHDDSGRPNKFKYGKMVARNGWYVWRVSNPNPSFKIRIKWNATFLLLMKLRGLNVFTTSNCLEALTETLGRAYGWLTLIFNKPKLQ